MSRLSPPTDDDHDLGAQTPSRLDVVVGFDAAGLAAAVTATRLGSPFGGLYCAGEPGQAVGVRYPSDGSNLSEALCIGQIAGEEAVK